MKIRQKRVSEMIKKAVAEIFLRDLNDPRIHLATITRVEVSADLLHAKIFVSVIGKESEQRNVLRGIKSAAGYIRNELGNRVKLRFLPHLQFIHDKSIEKAFEITKLIDELAEERKERENAPEDGAARGEDGAIEKSDSNPEGDGS